MPSFWSLFGSSAEQVACDWLAAGGYKILDRNWRRPWGELDIVAERSGDIHFIEVKAAKEHHAGFEPFVRAGHAKMAKVQRTARSWLAANNFGPDTAWQIDIISVIMSPEGPLFEHFKNI